MQVRRIDHFSLTVGDLERSTAFYERFGYEAHKRYISTGPDVDAGTDTRDAELEIGWLRHPLGGPLLELIRYRGEPAERSTHNSRVGAAHLCLCVDDVLGAHRDLSADGVAFLSDPHQDEFGVRWVYMRDPDGNVVELAQDP
jgi:catechol 2,3-dioxygenase-like lactoylglutathione lyase family enzyme